MHAPVLYLDTSAIGGYFDAEFMADTRTLWRLREAGRFRFVTSQIVINEIVGAPAQVRELMRSTFAADDALVVTDEMEALADAYLAHGVVPPKFIDDAHHVAACTVAQTDFLVSWNFKHLATRGGSRGSMR